MSGEPSEDEAKPAGEAEVEAAKPTPNDSGGVIPVEVEAPDAAAPDTPVAWSPAEVPVAEVPPPPDPVAELEKKVTALEKEKKDNWDKYLRSVADLDNLRKRQKRELEDVKFETKNKVLKEMLPVVDNLERAIEHASKGEEVDPILKPIVDGVQLVLRQFTTAFERLDIAPLDALGKPFDPNQHEAISQQESDQPAGTIVQVLQRGYKAGERLLRPALVVVAKAKVAAE